MTASGEPCIPQLLPPVSGPMKSTLMGEEAAAVVGSTTIIFSVAATGAPALSEIAPCETSKGSTTNGTGFESTTGGPGFST